MMMKQIKDFAFFLLFMLAIRGIAQQDFTLSTLDNVHQTSYVFPSKITSNKISIGLPVLSRLYFDFSNSGFTYHDIIRKRADDSLTINMDNMIGKLKEKNYLTFGMQTDLISIGLRWKNDQYFSFNVSEKIYSRLIYPKDLIVLLWEGNGKSLLGKRASFDGLGYDFFHYHEFAFGYYRKYREKWEFGGRIKYLKGVTNIYTKKSNVGLYTDAETYDLTFDGEMEIYTSGINELTDSTYQFDLIPYLWKKNTGFAFDLGASYQFNDKISFSASIVDLGWIKWRHDTRNFKQEKVDFYFSGIDLKRAFNQNDTTGEKTLQQLEDSIKNTFDLQDYQGSYTTFLNTRLYISGTYQLTEKISVGGIFHAEMIKKRFRPSITGYGHIKLTKWLNASATYSIYNRSWFNLGVGFSVTLGPLQWYFASDNLMGVWVPHLTKNVHLTTGINLVFGKEREPEASEMQID
jgi:hypothetical protein